MLLGTTQNEKFTPFFTEESVLVDKNIKVCTVFLRQITLQWRKLISVCHMLINRRNWVQLAMAALWENSCNLLQKKIDWHQIEVPRHLKKKVLLCKTCCNRTLNLTVLHILLATSMLLFETWPVTLQKLKLLLIAKYANNSHFHDNLFFASLAANPEH